MLEILADSRIIFIKVGPPEYQAMRRHVIVVFHDLGVEGALQDFYVAAQAGHLDDGREHLADLIIGEAVACDGESHQLV